MTHLKEVRANLRERLLEHDWEYRESDCLDVYRKGKGNEEFLSNLVQELGCPASLDELRTYLGQQRLGTPPLAKDVHKRLGVWFEGVDESTQHCIEMIPNKTYLASKEVSIVCLSTESGELYVTTPGGISLRVIIGEDGCLQTTYYKALI